MNIYSEIKSFGSFLPERVITNNDLAKIVDTSDEWITSRTGIKQRHMCVDGQSSSDLAYEAAKRAIDAAGLKLDEIDLIIVATTTADKIFPSVAVMVQQKLGMYNIPAFDVQAVCAGFIYILSIADSMIRSKKYKNILVIGVDTMTNLLDWKDRSTSVLFGDGAGAAVVSCSGSKKGIMDVMLYSDGHNECILNTSGGVSSNKKVGTVQMKGKEVFRHATEKLTSVALELLSKNNISIDEIDYIVPHQANKRIIDAIATKLGVSETKFIVTVDQHANTSAASIPLAFDTAIKRGIIKKGHKILLLAIGAGLAWGGALVEF